jgi:hypothetical protein
MRRVKLLRMYLDNKVCPILELKQTSYPLKLQHSEALR